MPNGNKDTSAEGQGQQGQSGQGQSSGGSTPPQTVDLLRTMAQNPDSVNLVYGLETAREHVRSIGGVYNFDDTRPHPFAKMLLTQDKSGGRPEAETRGPTTADALNNNAFRTFQTDGVRDLSIFNPEARQLYPTPMIQQEALREHRQQSTAQHPPEQQAVYERYQEGLLASKHSPTSTLTGDVAEMAKKENMPLVQGDGRSEAQVMFRHQTAISCKYGLQFGQEHGRILFELGSQDPNAPNRFDPNVAAEKRTDDGRASSSGHQLRSITNVELRTAFRHDGGEDRLQFFREGTKTQAPWDGANVDTRWADYAWDRVDKYTRPGALTQQQSVDLKLKLSDAYLDGTLGRDTFREVNATINAAKNPQPPGGGGSPASPYPLVDAVYQRLAHTEKDHPIPGIENVADRTRAASAIAAKMHEQGFTGLGGVHHVQKPGDPSVNGFAAWDASGNIDTAKRFVMSVDDALQRPTQDSLKTLDQPRVAEQAQEQPQRIMAKL